MQGKFLTLTVLFLLLLCLASTTTRATAQGLDADRIKFGLRTAAPEEDGFVDRVIEMVNEGRLPVALVESTFLWARTQPRHKFQYFQRGLILRAARSGIPPEAFERRAQMPPQNGADQLLLGFIDTRRIRSLFSRVAGFGTRFLR